MYPHIFQPLQFRTLSVKNRIFRSNISGRFDNYDGSGNRARINWELKFAKGGVRRRLGCISSPAWQPPTWRIPKLHQDQAVIRRKCDRVSAERSWPAEKPSYREHLVKGHRSGPQQAVEHSVRAALHVREHAARPRRACARSSCPRTARLRR